MLTDDYLQATTSVLSHIVASERDALTHVVTWFADSIAADGLVHTFGTGHSSLLACDGLYRAGGLACVNAIVEPFTTFESGAIAGTQFERTAGLAERILDRYVLQPEDTLVVFSNSGVNALPVEVTQLAQTRGVRTVAVSSKAYAKQASQQKGVPSLFDVADVAIDNHVVPGDAALSLAEGRYRMGSLSTITGAFIWNVLISESAALLVERGLNPPVYISSNMPDAIENNRALVDRYRHRIRHL